MYYVYILLSLKDGQFYTGYSTNLKQRLEYHQKGWVKSTKSRRPLTLIFYEAYISKEDALRREKYLKTNSGKKTLKLMLRNTINHI
jgi:putative endonuclease